MDLEEKRRALAELKAQRKIEFEQKAKAEREEARKRADQKAAARRLVEESEKKRLAEQKQAIQDALTASRLAKEKEDAARKEAAAKADQARKKKAAEDEEARKLEARKQQEAALLRAAAQQAERELADQKAREAALWHAVYSSRQFKHMSPAAKILLETYPIDGLLERLKDVEFLNRLELSSRKSDPKKSELKENDLSPTRRSPFLQKS